MGRVPPLAEGGAVSTDRKCSTCLGLVDEDGDTTQECPVNPPATCDDCGSCICDGSC